MARMARGRDFDKVEGLAVVTQSDVVEQPVPGSEASFLNYRFLLQFVDLQEDSNRIDVRWINARRDPKASHEQELEYARDRVAQAH